MVAQSGQEEQQDLDLADITHPISRHPRPRMFSYPKPDNTGDLTDRNTTQHVRRISSEKSISTPPGEVIKKGLTDHKVTKDLSNETSADPSSHAPQDMSTIHTTHKSPDAPLSNPTVPQSSPRRSMSYAVRSPAENKYMSPRMRSALHKFASAEQLLIQDSVTWLDILGGDRISQPQDSQEAFDLEMLSLQIGESVVRHNKNTANFNTLVLYLLSHMRAMRLIAYDGTWPAEAYNALMIVRLCVKHFVDNLTAVEIHEQFERDRTVRPRNVQITPIITEPTAMAVDTLVAQDRRFRAQQLLEELLQTLIYADAGSQPNHDFYLEALNTFLVLLGTQLNQPLSTAADGSYFLEILLERLSHFAGGAMQRLLMNFVHRPPTPTPAGGGMLYSAYSYLFSARRQEGLTASPIADRSALLFLLLCMQTPTHLPNEYRNVLKRFLDSNVAESGEEVVDDEQGVNVSFRHVHQTLCGTIAVEEATVIMYCLIVHNRRFRTYVLSRTDPESLMIPLLHQIYDLTERKEGYPQLYVLLIILVIISEDDLFNDTLQRINVPYQAWYTERVVKSTSVGGLVMLVLIKTIQANLATIKDAYVHALCIAVLSNMARNIVSISAMVAQRVLSFFDLVARRFARLCGQLPHEDSDDNLNATSFEVTDTELDTCIYYDLVALLLELINAILTHTLKQNPELVYALLHKREAFGQLADVPRFSSIVANIDLVIGYFHEKLEEANLKTPSAADVAGVIDRAAKTWNLSKLKTLSILKFQYEEDEESVNFFIPYVWNIVHKSGAVYWDSARISSGFENNYPAPLGPHRSKAEA